MTDTAPIALLARLGIEVPLVQAPMAGSGGVALAVAAASAGALGSLPAAMLDPATVEDQVDEFRRAVTAPVNLNFFCHPPPSVSDADLASWTVSLSRFDAELGVDRAAAAAPAPPPT